MDGAGHFLKVVGALSPIGCLQDLNLVWFLFPCQLARHTQATLSCATFVRGPTRAMDSIRGRNCLSLDASNFFEYTVIAQATPIAFYSISVVGDIED
jgi:hypothetical protein